eukprot:m.10046 g.10046  ORF g.10046 m.10046 type:complete len:65 (+) comp6820_c0_seq1:206-400(+)
MRARIPHGWPCDQTAVRWPIHPARGRSNGAIAAIERLPKFAEYSGSIRSYSMEFPTKPQIVWAK